jgi:transcriptional regulator with XRE-family HTH domain
VAVINSLIVRLSRSERCRDFERLRRRARNALSLILYGLRHWQACSESGPRLSQRTLARQLGVWPSYVCKVQRKALSEGMDTLARHGQRVTATDLDEARWFTNRIREQEPGLLAPAPHRLYEGELAASQQPRAMTAEESIAQTWREVAEWKRKHLSYGRRRVAFSVRVR